MNQVGSTTERHIVLQTNRTQSDCSEPLTRLLVSALPKKKSMLKPSLRRGKVTEERELTFRVRCLVLLLAGLPLALKSRSADRSGVGTCISRSLVAKDAERNRRLRTLTARLRNWVLVFGFGLENISLGIR